MVTKGWIEQFMDFLAKAFGWDLPIHTPPEAPKLPPMAPTEPLPVTQPVMRIYLWDTPEKARHSCRVIMDEYGLTWREKDILSACIEQESGFHPRAIGKPNSNGTIDYGLCQYNNGSIRGVPLWIGKGAAFKNIEEVLSDPEKNVRIMIKTYKAGHLNWWSSYSTGAYKKYLRG